MEPPLDGSNGPVHMTNMAAIPIYGKKTKDIFLWSRKADDLENCYTALNTRVLPSMFK